MRGADGDPVPGLAPAAKQMGNYVGRLIAARIAGRSLPPFHYRNQGDIGHNRTARRRCRVRHATRLKGFIGWLFWSVVHIYFLIGLRNRFVVAVTWMWGYLTFQRGARLITEVPPPRTNRDRRQGRNFRGSLPAEPVVALVLPIAAGVVVLHPHGGDVFGVLEAELGRECGS